MPEKVRGLPKVKAIHISSGGKHTGIVTEDGRLFMCGSNLHDKLGLEGITTGSKKSFKPVELLNQHKIIQVSCGEFHTMALTSEGQIYVWGGSLHNVSTFLNNFLQKRGDTSQERKANPRYVPTLIRVLEKKIITKIECGDFHSLALDQNGVLYAWGMNKSGECGNGKFEDVEIPTRMKFFDGKKVIDIAAGKNHSLALTASN